MSSTIYEAFDSAFAQVSAYAVLKDGEHVANVSFKHPPRGHGERRLTVFVHWIGLEMVKGWAGGCGYDKKTAACSAASRRLAAVWEAAKKENSGNLDRFYPKQIDAFIAAIAKDEGHYWNNQLESAGFTVLNVIA
ncbi:hypothetical protein M2322_002646 [Rhodoblastus acidophilus]|uniref:hypothetical protein n=1 Tax=Rhodoblastus acidophilus TaxID=1074 RepID=UPI002225ADDB|nr:hypothetical protein [Rhodoblastus acidophilus]MCW2317092.1 hypothetical protein [Rhodoblastus acidophilus]